MDRIAYQRLDQLEGQHWWFCARRKIIAAALKHFAPQRTNLRVLEAGCGTGGNLAMLSGLGKVEAFELDDEARAMAEAKMPIGIKPGILPDGIPFKEGSFDVVTAFDVIEHVEQDVESLHKLGLQLAPGGRLFMTVPAHPWMWSKHDVVHHHFRRYTRKSLDETLRKAGLEPVRLSYFNMFLFPMIAGLRVVRKAFGLAESDDTAMPGPLANGLLSKIFGAESALITRMPLPVGVSLMAVARRA